jgi:phosphotransferase system enzyme I (PtsI)
MVILKGKSVYKGIAIGHIRFHKRKEYVVKREHIEEVEKELEKVKAAKENSIKQLENLYEQALKKVGETEAQIFQVHQMMLEDEDYLDSITNIISTQKVNASYAVATTGDNFAQMFASMDDDYMKERAMDIKDISERLIQNLLGTVSEMIQDDSPYIVAADDLAPSETVQLDKDKVLAFITRKGSSNSHTAILARTMNIPAIIGIGEGLLEDYNNKYAIVDGDTGNIYIEPTDEVVKEMTLKKQEAEETRKLLHDMKGKPTETRDGRKVKLYANIGNAKDVMQVLQNDAEGIGLFRSEFLYLEKNDYPTEQEQFLVYKSVAENMAGKKVIIRTLDIGADKQIDYFDMEKEENPALGYRAIRICLDRIDIFKTQLRALFRASAFGNIAIMYPMIISLEEIQRIKQIANEVKQSLKEEQIPYGEVEQGIMIETPAAVMISDLLAKEVDFFSIGTNDLTQYTLAIDRQNAKLDTFYNPHHEAVLRMIQLVIDNSHKAGIWTGICGELGADTDLTKRFVEMGIDELSVSPSCILELRKIIREI